MYDYLDEYLMITGSKNRKNSSYREAQEIKKKGDAHIFDWMCREWISRFKWTSSEPSIATDLIEPALLYKGVAGISKFIQKTKIEDFDVEDLRLWLVSATGTLGFYNRPNQVTLTSYNGKAHKKAFPLLEESINSPISDCVLIFDSTRRYPPINTVLYYCKQLSMIQSRQHAGIANILPTTVITAEHEQKMAIEKQRTMANMGVPYVIEINGDTGLPTQPVQLVQNKGIRDELETLYELQEKVKSQYLNDIGIADNAKVNKMSGVNPIEITEGRQAVNLILNDALECRRKACEQVKQLFGIELNVNLTNFERNTPISEEPERGADEDV